MKYILWILAIINVVLFYIKDKILPVVNSQTVKERLSDDIMSYHTTHVISSVYGSVQLAMWLLFIILMFKFISKKIEYFIGG